MDGGPSHLKQVGMACKAGIHLIQLRMKEATDEEVLETALAAKKICQIHGATLIINDRVHVAVAAGADGVHLGQEDMAVGDARRLLGEEAIIGGTANTIAHVREHYRQGADYVGVGPFRYTTTKKKLSPILGLEGYQHIIQQMLAEGIRLPMVAIGGIGSEDVPLLIEAGVYGIAFSGMLVHAEDAPAQVKMLEAQLHRMLAGKG